MRDDPTWAAYRVSTIPARVKDPLAAGQLEALQAHLPALHSALANTLAEAMGRWSVEYATAHHRLGLLPVTSPREDLLRELVWELDDQYRRTRAVFETMREAVWDEGEWGEWRPNDSDDPWARDGLASNPPPTSSCRCGTPAWWGCPPGPGVPGGSRTRAVGRVCPPQLADDALTLIAAASLVTRQADIRVPDPGWFAPLRLLADEAVNRAMQAVLVRLHGWRVPAEPIPGWG